MTERHPGQYADEDEDDIEEIEAYCVRCKEKVVMENPSPVWTRRGAPGTRGECPQCGSTVFRMGLTDAHRAGSRPDMSAITGRKEAAGTPRPRRGGPRFSAYINYSPADQAFANRLADDLGKMGIEAWFTPDDAEKVSWASGVHPAVEECSHMVLVLSGPALAEYSVTQNWTAFKQRRKPVLIAQVEQAEVPDDLRRSPRFDFAAEYKSAFRQLLQALTAQA